MRILIELPTWLGDCVMATPAIENIAKAYPQAGFVFIGSPVSVEALRYHPQTQAVQTLNKSYTSLYKIAKSLGKFNLFVSFRSSVRSKALGFVVSAEHKYQFDKRRYQNQHQVEKYNNFVNDSLGIDSAPGKLLLHLDPKRQMDDDTPTLGINPGASYGSAKRWYPEEFAKVARQLSGQYDIVIFGGPGEIDMADDIESSLQQAGVRNYQNLAGKTSVSTLIEQISRLHLFITGDSGPMHVAAAFQVPTVAIFGPTKDDETSQWQNAKSSIVKKQLECQPCMKRACPLEHHNCMKLIKDKDILQAIEML